MGGEDLTRPTQRHIQHGGSFGSFRTHVPVYTGTYTDAHTPPNLPNSFSYP